MRVPRVRFTVRRMMVAVAVIATALGVIAWYGNLVRTQRRAIMLIRRHDGGRIGYDYEADATTRRWAPLWLSRLLGDDYLYSVTNVGFHKEQVSTADDPLMIELRALPRLSYLNLRHTSVTDLGLDHLKAFTNLRTLCVHSAEVSEAKVAELQRALPRLEIIRGCWCDSCNRDGCDRAARCRVGLDEHLPPPQAPSS